tara:strand:+ start:6227 stop:8500 length:2274 start_codon:yes stop_codon:yes gene_type:complete
MNQYPAKPFMDQMAQHGRYGDSMLVHMNPVEVQGIAALSPTGSLTTNPITGQPEAFLPFLAPILGSMLGSSVLPAMIPALAGKTALASAIGSGLMTTAMTGDIKKGLLSGITGFGLGQVLGAAGDALNPAIGDTSAALDAAQTAASEAGVSAATAGADLTALQATPDVASGALDAAKQADAAARLTQTGANTRVSTLENTLGDLRGQQSIGDRFTAPFKEPGAFGKALVKPSSLAAIGVGEGQKAALTAQEEFEEEGRRFEREREEDYLRNVGIMNRSFEQLERDYPGYKIPRKVAAGGGVTSIDPAHYGRSLNGLQDMIKGQSVVRMNNGGEFNPNQRGISSLLRNNPNASINVGGTTYRYGDSGITSSNPTAESRDAAAGAIDASADGGILTQGARAVTGNGANDAYQRGADAAARQAGIRGSEIISREELAGYRPGFDAEISYFRSPSPAEPPPFTGGNYPPADAGDLPPENAGDGAIDMGGGPGFEGIPKTNGTGTTGGITSLRTEDSGVGDFTAESRMDETIDPGSDPALVERAILDMNNPITTPPPASDPATGGGITDIPTGELTPEQQAEINILREIMGSTGSVPVFDGSSGPGMRAGGDTSDFAMNDTMEANGQLLIERAVMAISGRLPEEEAEVVIANFVDEFGPEAFQILREKVLQEIVPNAQTEGEIVGSGGGMDDRIPGMIGADQPVAVSPGEYIVPADVVSGIGDGSTDAGVQELDGMLDRVRMERTGTMRQPQPMRSGGAMPA